MILLKQKSVQMLDRLWRLVDFEAFNRVFDHFVYEKSHPTHLGRLPHISKITIGNQKTMSSLQVFLPRVLTHVVTALPEEDIHQHSRFSIFPPPNFDIASYRCSQMGTCHIWAMGSQM